jgi:hypothetical protein
MPAKQTKRPVDPVAAYRAKRQAREPKPISIRLEPHILKSIDAYAKQLNRGYWGAPQRTRAIRDLIERGLKTVKVKAEP